MLLDSTIYYNSVISEQKNDELINDELINDELINDELINDELINDELINDELINDELINIVIGTTSLNRPVLHTDIFTEWIKWFDQIDKKKYKLVWFINIDIIENLGVTYEETVENYNKLLGNFTNMVNVHYLKCENNKGNFLKACQRLATNIENYIEKLPNKNLTKIVWLEDDWKLNLNQTINININTLIETYSGSLTSINLTFIRNNYIHALAPSIVSYKLWRMLHYEAWTNQNENIDPEHCIGKYFSSKYGKYGNINNITVINRKIDEKYLEQTYINFSKSYYTYTNKLYSIKKDNRFVELENIKDKFDNVMTFIRITPTFCIDGCDYGRKFMDLHSLKKNKGEYGDNFYIQ
jgi:hypothetical protein